MNKLIAQIMKFGVVGGLAFIIDFGLMVFLTEVFGLPYLLSATLSFIASLIFNYIASMRYVFAHRSGMSRRREFIIFVVLSFLGLLINNICLYMGTQILGMDYRFSKIIVTFIVMAWNFITRKLLLDGEHKEPAIQPGIE